MLRDLKRLFAIFAVLALAFVAMGYGLSGLRLGLASFLALAGALGAGTYGVVAGAYRRDDGRAQTWREVAGNLVEMIPLLAGSVGLLALALLLFGLGWRALAIGPGAALGLAAIVGVASALVVAVRGRPPAGASSGEPAERRSEKSG